MEIGYCLECRELNYAMTNANGTFERANMSNNHEGHKQYIFEAPECLARLKSCSDGRNIAEWTQYIEEWWHRYSPHVP